jgi:hypothetical protein
MQQKISSRLIPETMEKSGTITICCHPKTEVTSTYTISELDGRMCVSGWKEFMTKENHLKIGDKMLFLLYLGTEGLYLFATHVPEIGLN